MEILTWRRQGGLRPTDTIIAVGAQRLRRNRQKRYEPAGAELSGVLVERNNAGVVTTDSRLNAVSGKNNGPGVANLS